MKILATGDIHGDKQFVDDLVKQADAEDVDLVVIAGDIADFWGPTEKLVGPFVKNNRKVCIIPGNHDTFASADAIAELYGITNLHGYTYNMGDIGLFGCGGANFGAEQLSENQIFDLLKQGHERVKDKKTRIMVTHIHPSGTQMEKMTDFVPSSDGIRKAIELFKPDLVLCGHVHEASGIEEMVGDTKVINVARTGKVIDLKKE